MYSMGLVLAALLVLCCVVRDNEQQRAVYEEYTVWRGRGVSVWVWAVEGP